MKRPISWERDGGFTVVELAIVLTIMLIIMAIAVPGYQQVIRHAHEDTHYLPEIPVDPMTGSADTWEVILEDVDAIALSGERGIIDVKSGSNEVDSSGERRYSDW